MKTAFVLDSPQRALPAAAGGAMDAIGYEKEGKANGESPGKRRRFEMRRWRRSAMAASGAAWKIWRNGTRTAEGYATEALTRKLALTPSQTRDGKRNNYAWVVRSFSTHGQMLGYGHHGLWRGFAPPTTLPPGRPPTVILSNRGDFDEDKILVCARRLIEHTSRSSERVQPTDGLALV